MQIQQATSQSFQFLADEAGVLFFICRSRHAKTFSKYRSVIPDSRLLSKERVKIIVAIFAALLGGSVGAQEVLVAPPHLDQVAKAHHCVPIVSLVKDEESAQSSSFDLRYEFHYGSPKALLAAWCRKDAAKPSGPYTLLIWAERLDQPLHSCPDEIPNLKRIGHPVIDAWPKIPHDFVMIDTGDRPSVQETQVMFGVENHLPEGVDYYACVAGRWARFSPERK